MIIQPNLFALDSVLIDEDAENDENYTPLAIVAPFRDLVGGVFDLDPFSCLRANQNIQASTYWIKADDAFARDWTPYQRKWVNPPYSKGNIERAVENVLSYAHIGHSFLLVNSNTSSNWFLDAQNYSTAYLTFNHRIPFLNPNKPNQNKGSGNAKSQTLFYFGKFTANQFKACCNHLGNVSVVI